MTDANPDADTDSESTEYDEDRTECPECGGDIYYEPRITHGSEYEPTGGHVCLDCTWSVIDPDSATSETRVRKRADSGHRPVESQRLSHGN